LRACVVVVRVSETQFYYYFLQVAAVVFSMTALEANQAPALTAEAQREFVRLAGLSLLRLGTSVDRDQPKNRDAVFVLLDMVFLVLFYRIHTSHN
jgi:hypothetical protein